MVRWLTRGAALVYGLAKDGLETILPAGHWRVAIAMTVEGRCRALSGDLDAAEPLLTEGWRRLEEVRTSGDQYREAALSFLVEFYELSGRTDEAQRHRVLLERETR